MRAYLSGSLAARCVISAGVFIGLAAATAAMQPQDVTDDPQRAGETQPDRRRSISNPVPSIALPDRLLSRFTSQEQARETALASRAQSRAFEGAPPVVPHQLQGTTLADCVDCHEFGKRSGRKLARKMSHTNLVACMQCHVEQTNSEFGQLPSLTASSFEGLRPDGIGGDRAYDGAPPLTPHLTLMRTNCNSCHGPHGYEGFRTTHPERLNCVQCHGIGAEFDQLAPTFNWPTQ